MSDKTRDEPFMFHPLERVVEEKAIAMYRAAHPDGPAWQELHEFTRTEWVRHVESAIRNLGPVRGDMEP